MDSSKLGNQLKKIIKGQVLWDDEILSYYSVDASSYHVRPKVVVIPKMQRDIIELLRYASKSKISVTARGAGTGLVGGALGHDIIIDMKNFQKIKVSEKFVQVQAGVLKGNLDTALIKHKKFIGPNPSIGPYCTIGGMIATNASGSRSLKYGSIIDNLIQVTLVTGKGSILKLPSKTPMAKTIVDLARCVHRNKFPNVTKNSCGFRLDAATNQKIVQKVIAGSEGTLGIIISAKLKIFKIPSKKLLFILKFDSVNEALKKIANINKLKPSLLEIIDHNILQSVDYPISKKTKSILFVEFDSDLKNSSTSLHKMIDSKNILLKINTVKEIQKWLSYRDTALSYSITKIPKSKIMPHIIEDAVVPVCKLTDLMSYVNKINKIFKTKFIFYGHAGNGNLHIRLISKTKNKQLIRNIASLFFSKVIELGGSITGEHGDGLARSEFVEKQYGTKTLTIFKKLKKEFDPYSILNPDKIITKKKFEENLKIN